MNGEWGSIVESRNEFKQVRHIEDTRYKVGYLYPYFILLPSNSQTLSIIILGMMTRYQYSLYEWRRDRWYFSPWASGGLFSPDLTFDPIAQTDGR